MVKKVQKVKHENVLLIFYYELFTKNISQRMAHQVFINYDYNKIMIHPNNRYSDRSKEQIMVHKESRATN